MRRFIFMLACLAALPATAQEPMPDAMLFGSYHDMLKQLRANGIDPANVAWAEVNPLCVGFLSYKDDQSLYNRCVFDKAILATSFANDRETCTIESLAVTPDSLRKNRTVITTYKPGPENDEQAVIESPRISRAELKISRTATYNRCMVDFGWQNPRDWRRGRAR